MSNIDSKINELFQVLEKQKKDVEATEKAASKKWHTNCSLQFMGQHPYNIQTASEDVLRNAVSQLLIHKDYAKQAADVLNLPVDNTFAGYTYDHWIEDCKTKIAKIQLRAKKEKLNQLEERLNAIVSPEQRRQMELDAIVKELGE